MWIYFVSEFSGRDRPRQLALNGSTTEYHLKNVVHDTEYVLTLYVLFGSVVGPGVSATFKTCEQQNTDTSQTHRNALHSQITVIKKKKKQDSFEVEGLHFAFMFTFCDKICSNVLHNTQ